MTNNQTESKPADAEQESGKGLDGTTCSASSDTPETDKAFPKSNNWHHPDSSEYLEQRGVAAKLERQRNAAWKTLKEIRELFIADESFGATVDALFAKPLEEAEDEIARLQSLLNASILP